MSDFIGDSGSNELTGLGGNDFIQGLGGDDTLVGAGGNDILEGGKKDDLLEGGDGNDRLKGGSGDDTLVGGDGDDTLVGGKGADIQDGGNGNDTYRFVTADSVASDTYADTGVSGTDELDATQVTHLRLGDDFDGSSGMEVIRGDEDGGTAIFGSGLQGAEWDFSTMELLNISLISGSGHDDNITGSDGEDNIRGIGGDDILYGNAGDDTLVGNGGDDTLYGGEDEDTVKGGGGDDTLFGGAGNDLLKGGGGSDWLDGGDGEDDLRAGGGSDFLIADTDDVSVDGEGGDDTLRVAGSGQELDITGTGGDMFAGIEAIDLSNDSNTLILDKASVKALSDESNTVRITGGSTDAVNALGLEWTVGSDVVIDEITYDTYSIGGVKLQIQAGIDQVMINTVGNDPVTADNDAVSVDEDGSSGNLIATVLDGDLDPDTDEVLRVIAAGTAAKGTVTFNAGTASAGDETLTYTADGAVLDALGAGESTTDTFTYTIDDGHGSTDTATVTVTINGVDDGPSAGDDFIILGNGNDTVDSLAGNDTINGNGGDDTLSGGSQIDTLNGGIGNDTLSGDAGNDILNGDDGDDTLTGGADGDTMNGGLGIDTLDYEFAPGAVILSLNAGTAGGDGSDTFTSIENVIGADGFNDTITGDALDNVLMGLGGNDTISSGDGNNTLIGDDGNDILTGGTGNDLLRGGAGDDTMAGGAGSDTVDYSDAVELLTITLGPTGSVEVTSTGNGNDSVSEVENITGSNFNDAIIGNATDNVLKGGAGEDTMDGAAGNDTLNGGLGNDLLTGTSGDDNFVFDSVLGPTNVDSIAVFEGAGAGGGDVISLDDAIFTTLTGGFTANNFVSAASAPTAGDANDFILYDQTSGALFYDADGNGAGSAVQFATLSDSPDTLAFGDFTII